MNVEDLIAWRKRAGLTQAELGERIGLNLRSVSQIENGRAELRTLHILAVERVSLDLAVERGDPMLALPPMRKAVLALFKVFSGE